MAVQYCRFGERNVGFGHLGEREIEETGCPAAEST